MAEEIWKEIKGYEGLYQVSNFGRVRSFHDRHKGKEKILATVLNRDGYLYLTLSKDKKQKAYYVHRLVAEAFLQNPNNLPDVNHKNIDNLSSSDNKADNRVENLEWITDKDNTKHAYKHGLKVSQKGSESSRAKFSEEQVLKIRELYSEKDMSYRKLAKKYNISLSAVRDIITRKTWTHI